MLSRKNKYEEKKFAADLGYRDELCKALIKLHIQNLSAMDADPCFQPSTITTQFWRNA
jgi:STE24 endopeptidase